MSRKHSEDHLIEEIELVTNPTHTHTHTGYVMPKTIIIAVTWPGTEDP